MNTYDVIVIGAGPGGYVAAIRAAQLGGKVLLVEKNKVGGVCLNWGCIPTKAVLASTALFDQIKKSDRFGISLSDPQIDFKKVIERKDRIVNKLIKGIELLLKKNKVELVAGEAQFEDLEHIKIVKPIGEEAAVKGKAVILATGSSPAMLPGIIFDKNKNLCSDDLFVVKETIPAEVNIVGGGVIGIHFAEIYHSLGCQVTIYEALGEILPGFDSDVIKFVRDMLKRKKIIVKTSTPFEPQDTDAINMICAGRTPNTRGIINPALKIERKNVLVNEKMETSIPNVFAIGDITGIKMLAHVAEAQGIVAAENAMGLKSRMEYSAIPITIYTHPEIGTIGLTEEEARKNHEITVGKFPFSALGHANAIGEIEGFIKVIAEKESGGEILGVHIVGPQASTLIGIASIAMSNKLSIEKFIKVIYAHPSLPEGVFEAGLNALSRSIHL